MKGCKLLCPLTMLATVLISPFIMAADDQRIIVTATRLDNIEQQAGFITIITVDDIAASAAATLPELLATEAGVMSRNLYGNNATRASVDMRGFGATAKQNTLILVDGRRLNDVDMAAVDFSAIPLANIERIEIIRGGGSVLYGDSAGGGVINIISKKAAGQQAVVDLGLTIASFNQRQLDVNAATTVGTTHLLATLSTINSDGYRDNNELQQRNVHLGMRTPLKTGEWFLALTLNDQELGLPGARSVDPGSSIDELATDRNGTSTPLDYANQDGLNISAGVTRYLSDHAELVIDAGYRNNNQQAYYDYGGGFSDYYDTGLATVSITPRLTMAYDGVGPGSSATAGIDIYRSRYDSDRALNPSTISTPIHRLAIDQTSRALYASNRTRITNATNITAGARIQAVSQRATDRYDATAPGAFDSEAPAFRDDYRETMWQLGVHHQSGEALSLSAGIERAVRFATVDEIFEYDPLFKRVFSPLKPQTGFQYNMGFGIKGGQTVFRGNLYYMNLDNEIHFDPLTFTNINLDPTRRRGAEFSLQQAVSDDVGIKASYTYMQATFRDGAYAGNTVPLVPRNSASLTTHWQTGTASRVSASLNYVGSQYFDNDQNNTFGEKIPAYTTADLKYMLGGKRWNLDVLINNALDKEYFGYGVSSTTTPGKYNAYPDPGRVLSLSLSRRF